MGKAGGQCNEGDEAPATTTLQEEARKTMTQRDEGDDIVSFYDVVLTGDWGKSPKIESRLNLKSAWKERRCERGPSRQGGYATGDWLRREASGFPSR